MPELFLENGLEISGEMNTVLSEEALQAMFQNEFEFWRQGISSRSHRMYFELAKQTQAIYEALTRIQKNESVKFRISS